MTLNKTTISAYHEVVMRRKYNRPPHGRKSLPEKEEADAFEKLDIRGKFLKFFPRVDRLRHWRRQQWTFEGMLTDGLTLSARFSW